MNRHYYGTTSTTDHRVLVGSWGKGTEIRPPRDIDVLFELPPHIMVKFMLRSGNQQSQLLQEVKEVLAVTNPNTGLRADGQVIVVPFGS